MCMSRLISFVLAYSSCEPREKKRELQTEKFLPKAGFEAKSRKYQGVFEVKSRVKTWQVQGIWSQQLEHKQVLQCWNGTRCPGRVSVPCWHATPVANETTHNR